MALTQKHYELIARTMGRMLAYMTAPGLSETNKEIFEREEVELLCTALQEDSPRFDPERFKAFVASVQETERKAIQTIHVSSNDWKRKEANDWV